MLLHASCTLWRPASDRRDEPSEVYCKGKNVRDARSDKTVATIDLTPDQILEAARQLPAPARRRLVQALQEAPTSEKARALAGRLRRGYRLPAKQRERLGQLLAKGNAGSLSAAESTELDRLVEAFEKQTLALAQAIARGGQRPVTR
jgi:hypothetical protein